MRIWSAVLLCICLTSCAPVHLDPAPIPATQIFPWMKPSPPPINLFCNDNILTTDAPNEIIEPIPCAPPIDCDGMFDRESDRYQRCQLTL